MPGSGRWQGSVTPEPCHVQPCQIRFPSPRGPKLAILGAGFIALDLLRMLLSGFKMQCLYQRLLRHMSDQRRVKSFIFPVVIKLVAHLPSRS